MKKICAGIIILAVVFTACAKSEPEKLQPGFYIDGQLRYGWESALSNNWLNVEEDTVLYNDNYKNINRYIKGELVISESITSIGRKALDGRYQLSAVILPKELVKLEAEALSGLVNVTEFKIPHLIKEIPESCFKGDKKLKSVYLHKSVTYIGSNAFSGCERLHSIYFGGTKRQWKKVKVSTDALDGSRVLCVECSNGRMYINKKLEELPLAAKNCIIWSFENYGGFSSFSADVLSVGEFINGKQSLEDFRRLSLVGGKKNHKTFYIKAEDAEEYDLIVSFPTVRLNYNTFDYFLCDGETNKVIGMFIPNDY